MKIESYSDGKKKKEDFIEIAFDIIKSFAIGITGIGPIDPEIHVDMKSDPLDVEYNIFEAYSENIAVLLPDKYFNHRM